MDNNYLAHYGVKGMKWGVRREIGKKARLGATAGRLAKGYARASLNALSSKRADKYAQLSRKYSEIQDRLYKDLSEKDIRQGRRALLKSTILTGVIGRYVEYGRERKLRKMVIEEEKKNRRGE